MPLMGNGGEEMEKTLLGEWRGKVAHK